MLILLSERQFYAVVLRIFVSGHQNNILITLFAYVKRNNDD